MALNPAMNILPLITVLYIIFLIPHTAKGNYIGGNESQKDPISTNGSLIVLGRSGSGISSTVRQLLGPYKDLIRQNSTDEALIQIYEVPLLGGRYFKVVDVKGLVDGTVINHDAQVISTLKSYLNESLQQNDTPFFLVISKFDDSRLHGIKSTFSQVFKRIQTLQEDLYGNASSHTALLLTRFMTSDKSVQRSPWNKTAQFRQALRDFTSFPADSMQIILGENLPEEYNLQVENGQVKLPNKEHYPQNVFDSFHKITTSVNDSIGESLLREFMECRFKPEEIIVKSYYNSNSSMSLTKDSFFMKFHLFDSEIEETDLSTRLIDAFDSFNDTFKLPAISSLIHLLSRLQSEKLTSLSNLPTNNLENVKFFQTFASDRTQISLLSIAFNLEMAEYVEHPVVGYGFDLTMDESLITTPFVENRLEPSLIGYLLPDFVSCSPMENPNQVDIAVYNETLPQYVQSRLELFHFERDERLENFEGLKLKTGFNLKPMEHESLLSLSTVREFRALKCELVKDKVGLNDEFKNTINEFSLCDRSLRDGVTEWQAFFNKYGTHVVSLGYGGGKIEGSFRDKSLKEVFKSREAIEGTLNRMVNFGNFSTAEAPTYRFFGGSRDIPSESNYSLALESRNDSLFRWKSGLRYDPIMLDYELSLTPISTFASLVNLATGEEVHKCMELLLSGNLTYKRKPKPTTKRPIQKVTINTTYVVPTLPTVHESYLISAIDKNISRYPTPSEGTNEGMSPTEVQINANDANSQFKSELGSEGALSYPTITSKPPPTVKYEKPDKSIWVKPDDYSLNTIGQGYNLLTGVVLEKSPLDLGLETSVALGPYSPEKQCTAWSTYWDGCVEPAIPEDMCFNRTRLTIKKSVKLHTLEYPLSHVNEASFKSQSEYIRFRIASTSGSLFDTGAVPYGFLDKIPDWVFISSGNYTQRKETEWRFAQLTLLQTTTLSKDFLKHLHLLPPMSSYNCTIKNEWKNFFEIYGTHYVKLAYVGIIEKSRPTHTSTYVNEIFLSLNETSQNMNDTSQNMNDTSQNMNDTSQNMNDTSQNIIDTSQNMNDTSQNMNDTSQNMNDTSQNMNDTSQNMNDTSQNMNDTSQNMNDTSQNMKDTFQNMNDTSQNISDISKPSTSSKKGKTKNGNCDKEVVILKSSMIVERIGVLLSLPELTSLKVEVDEAYYQLLKNNLDC